MNSFNLQPIWDATFAIYHEMDAICQKYGLRLFVSYGTVLGAIRHKGPIPWDDDFDVSMPRPDFMRFIELAPRELPHWLKLVSWQNSRSYLNFFPKIILSDKARVDDVCRRSGLPAPQGIFVDIFPIDGYPVGSFIGKAIRIAGVAMSRFLIKIAHDGKWNCVMNSMGSMLDYDSSSFVVDWAGWVAEERRFAIRRKSDFMRPVDFGNGVYAPYMYGCVRLPANFDKYLKWLYGDYMTLPPDEDRHPSHIVDGVSPAKWRLGPC